MADPGDGDTNVDAYLRVMQILAGAPSLQAAAPELVRAIAERFGWEAGALWIADEREQSLGRVGGWSAPEIDAHLFDEIDERLALSSGAGLPGRVWETGEVVWIEDLQVDHNSPRAQAAAAAGLRAAVAFPVRSATAVGVLEFLAASYRPIDREAVEALSTLGRQIGQAIERWRTEALLRASEEVKAAVVGAALDCVITMNAEGCVVDFNPAAERTFGYSREQAVGEELAELIIPPQLRDPHRSGLRRVLNGEPSPILNKRIELTGLRADGEEFPVELTVVRARGGSQPLFAGFIRDVSERQRAEAAQRQLLAAEREARVRAEAAERRARELATTLQESLLPPELPEVPGVETAARFRAGGEGVDVGGDFYDVNARPGGWGLVIGDVCGKGPGAATVAGLARYTVRAVAMREAKPAAVLKALNEALLAHSEGAMTSVAYLAIAERDFCLAIGGHPKPLLIRADGSVEEVGVTGTILGLRSELDLADHSFRLEEGQLLLFYTDGVTETRTPAGRFGTERLKESVRECAGASPAELVDHILETVIDRRGHHCDDDVALLALCAG